jgi:hypothetical protein
MHEFFIVFAFVAMVIAPAVAAAVCTDPTSDSN